MPIWRSSGKTAQGIHREWLLKMGRNSRKRNKPDRLWNVCKRCDRSTRGAVIRWPNGKWYWECPHCLNAQGYPR